ncbi:MAG: cysteine desulfurase family protein [Eubacteriales bacterium]|nr:cysteine desulfurase family protein [Eubacteriales bacterium]
MEIYLDNSSTTRPYQSVCDKVADVMRNNYGNPSSLHRLGIAAEKEIKEATSGIADALGVRTDEIFYTSGGTESNNLAIRGVCAASRHKKIVSTPIEHPATLNTLYSLEEQGYTVEFAPVDSDGKVILSEFEELITPDTALVTAMLVNNEIGTVEPIAKMSKIVRKKAPDAYFHVDAVQGFCKVPCKPSELGIDLMSISGHKIHGPKGTGVLYIKKGTHLDPILFGGGQQKGIRPGTENVPGIAGLGVAAKKCHANSKTSTEHMRKVLNRLKQKLVENIDNIRINTPQDCAPHILNVSFGGVRSEVLLHSLENEGIYVSSGSACSSHKKEPSYVLTAIGVDRAMIDGSIRFSLCEFNTEEEADRVAADAAAIVKRLRKLNLR